MPIFECGTSKINLPEGHSYIFLANPNGAEWKVIPYLCNIKLTKGEHYTVRCQHGSLVVDPNPNPQQ